MKGALMVAESFKRSHKLLALCVALAFASAALALGFAVTANAQEGGSSSQPTISSDKADYPPGATVVLTGSGWQPGESVHINVNDEAGKTWSRDVDVTADENGNVRDEFQLPNWFVATYNVTATGAQSGEATTSFTDAAVTLQGKSNPACTSGGQCDGGYQNGNLTGWKELDQVPFRLKFASTGNYTVVVDFDHVLNSDSTKTGVQDLYDWAAGNGVTLNSATLTDSSGPVWAYTVSVNVTSIPQPAGFAAVNFKGNLSAGAHNFTGSSLAVGADNGGGNVQIVKPAAAPGSPDLAVTKSGPATAAPGSTITYTLNYQNKATAASTATGVQLTDILPSGVTYVSGSCSGTCSVAGNEVVWNLGNLAPGASGSRTLQVQIPANAAFGTNYTDTGRILSAENDANISDNLSNFTTTVSFNRNPVANNDSYNANEDQALNVADGPNDVLANDTDPDNDTLSVTGNTQPSHGSVTVNPNGSFTYTPAANYNGPDSFNYTVSDGKGGTATGTVNITVNPVNDTPTITPNIGDKTILEDADTGDISFTIGDADSAAGDLIVTASSSDTTLVPNDNANLILGGSGANRTIKVKPAANRFGGPATITLTVSDGSQSATETFDVNVTPVNDAPSFDVPAGAPSVDEDAAAQTVANFATNLFVGPFETSQTITGFQVTNNSNPSLFSAGPAIDPDSGDLTYTPAPDAFGTANVTVRAKDDGGTANGGVDTSASKTFSITIDSVNDAPVNSVPGTQNINEDQSRVFSGANGNQISISDVDAGSDDVKVTLTADHGKITLGGLAGLAFSGGDGTSDSSMTFTGPITAINAALNLLTFAPDANYDGLDAKLTILTNDLGHNGSGGEKTDTDTVAFDIAADNDPPVIDSVVVTNANPVEEGSPATIKVTATDPDTPSSELRYSFDCDNDGTFEKGPQAADTAECTYFDNGTYPVQVKVTDDADNSDTDSVNVTVVNVAPAATFDAAPNTIDEGQNINLSLTSVVDPGTLDTHEYAFKCGDADWTGFGSSSTHTCPTTDDGQVTVKGQVRDDDGGLSPVYEETITVNNVPPNVDPPEGGQNGENQSSDEGQDKTFDVGSFTDPGADGPWNVTVNWGDGSQNTTFSVPESARLQDGSFDLSGQHKYDDNGEYDVTVTVAEDGQNAPSGQASFKITVNNVAPTATFDAAPNSINEGDNINLSLKDVVDPGTLDTHEYRFDCGDGTFGAWTELPASGEATISCPADDDGNVTVRGQVRDDDGGESPVYEETITVSNTAPRVTLLSGPDLVKESTTIERTYTFNATDAGDDTLTIDVGCGTNGELVDANGADPGGTYSYDPATGDGSFKCVFPDGGPNGSTQSNVTVKATDDGGVSDSDNQVVIVTVENDNPQATFNAPGSVNEGDNINLSLTDATDPAGSNDTLEYAFKCGDADWSGFGSSNTASCPTNDNGQVIVKGQVRDEDGGQSDVYEKTVTVNNVAPKVVLSGPDKANEGDTKTYNFTVTDPGTADTFTIENGYPTCGQNGQLVGGSLQTNASGGSFECRFPDGDSTTNVEIQVRDDDGALDADSQRVVIVEVANVAPVLTAAADQAANEGTGKDFDLGSFTDPGDDASWNVTVDWGDGSQSTTFDIASPGNLPQKPHTYADDGPYTVTVTVAEAGQNAPSDTKTFTVTVANVRPTVSLTGPDKANEGDTKTYNFTVTDPGTADTHTIDRSCGANGTEVQGSFSYDQNTKTGSFECRFPDGPAETNVTVKATDDRESDQDNQRVVVTVANVAPTVELTGPDKANEGDTKKYDFTITDPGDDNHTVDWDCGANGEKVNGSFAYDQATKTGSFECRFPDGPAETDVSVTANDGDGSGSDSTTVNVANVAPTANDDQMNTTELQSVTTNLLDNDSDPGNDLDAASLKILGASGPNDGVATIGALLDGNVSYLPNRGFIGGDSFRYEICDDDGDCSSANVQVTVGPVDCNAQGVIRGTQRADVLRGTAGNDIICAFAGNDTIYAGGGDDLVIGDSGDDRMWGQDGGDVMRGGANTDAMDGGLGDDYLSGDSGRDVMLGRGGIDFLAMRDNSAGDAGNGGAGTDTCAKDAGDRTVSCERQQ